MTRAWYGSFVHALWNQTSKEKVTVDFIYVPSLYTHTSNKSLPNEIFSPVEGFSGLTIPNLPTSLVLGIGTEEGRSIGLKEEIDPLKTIIFYADPSIDELYPSKTLKANSELVRRIEPASMMKYSILDSVSMFSSLNSVCSGLLRSYRVVLASLGPKIFSLCCFLIATMYPETSVWRISPGSHGKSIDLQPSNYTVVLEIEWSK